MQIDIKTDSFPLTDDLRGHAEKRLQSALTFCDENIQRIVMRLSDINDPRGRVDKCCRLHVVLAGLPDVVIEDIETDLYVAIDRAANHAGRAVRRQLMRSGRPGLHHRKRPDLNGSDRKLTRKHLFNLTEDDIP